LLRIETEHAERPVDVESKKEMGFAEGKDS
jgi:hypothetical protein